MIEVKRDAEDEHARSEAMEVQGIRYAASSRKMSAEYLVNLFERYLQKTEGGSKAGVVTMEGDSEAVWQQKARERIADHLSTEERTVDPNELPTLIIPREKQRLYLVASDFDGELISACAWLHKKGIDIYCFRLRAFKVGPEVVLERERLIPPPDLDEFMYEMAAPQQGGETVGTVGAKALPDRPVRAVWDDDPGDLDLLDTWKDLLVLTLSDA